MVMVTSMAEWPTMSRTMCGGAPWSRSGVTQVCRSPWNTTSPSPAASRSGYQLRRRSALVVASGLAQGAEGDGVGAGLGGEVAAESAPRAPPCSASPPTDPQDWIMCPELVHADAGKRRPAHPLKGRHRQPSWGIPYPKMHLAKLAPAGRPKIEQNTPLFPHH